jgi:hypothetical protein
MHVLFPSQNCKTYQILIQQNQFIDLSLNIKANSPILSNLKIKTLFVLKYRLVFDILISKQEM